MTEDEKIICSEEDTIDILQLAVRVYNALRRSGIKTIRQLIEVRNADKLFSIRNLGEKGVAQIEEKLANIALIPMSPQPRVYKGECDSDAYNPNVIIDLGPPQTPVHEVVKWQQTLLAKQIRAGLLHPNVIFDNIPLGELVHMNHISQNHNLYLTMSKVLTSSLSVTDELEFLLSSMNERQLKILQRRYGFQKQTLETVGNALSITRERVRQIEKQVESHIKQGIASISLIRIRSAVLFAHDHDMDVSFEGWSQRLMRTGLLGDWTNEEFSRLDQIELMVAICRLTHDSNLAIEFPKSLDYMLELHSQGRLSTPARVLYLIDKVSNDGKKLLQRHLQHSGAVYLEWLVEHKDIPYSQTEIQEILKALDFAEVGNGWYMSYEYHPGSLGKNHVFHKSLFKMFQYCGPLEIRDISMGMEHALVKSQFPVPPPGVLQAILKKYGYSTEDDLWYWDGEMSEELNTGEAIILETIRQNNGVVHHSGLAQAIIDSSLSFPSLHATLRRSPLFDNFGKSLYKLRGSQPSYDDIEHAHLAVERVPVNLQVDYDSYGNIIIQATLSRLAIGNGTVVSDKLPHLKGEWQYQADGDENGLVVTTDNKEIRGLSRILRHLGCEVGGRIQLTFNTWKREVTIDKQENNP